ncbi:hypothetical protein ACHHV8_10805 [Paenibacillus sp. TAB 01]|uniref:hypothetical protein n=1 Tax=Paenibacillus sp. TAB 01 TaxID=3368988 RepID=UPI0037526BCE
MISDNQKELRLICDYFILPIVITIVNKNRLELKDSPYTLRSLYTAIASIIINRMRADLESVRGQLKELNISVIHTKEQQDGDWGRFPYLYQGRRLEFVIQKETARQEIKARLKRYMKEALRFSCS